MRGITDRRAEKMVNQSYDIKEVFAYFEGYYPTADTLRCPFHMDNRKSAKVFRDADGDKIYCFAEARQFRVSDLIRRYGDSIADWLTPEMRLMDIGQNIDTWDLSVLDGFRKGEFGIKEVFLRTIQLKTLV